MKKVVIVLITVVALALATIPASAQLGDVDNSSFTVRNVGSGQATVQITFYEEDGTEHTPSPLNASKPNPFTLDAGESFEVYLPGIPGLDDGRYSAVISSDQEVVAIANVIGENTAGTAYWSGAYSGFSSGSDTMYLPAIVYEYYDWNSLISVQNTGSSATDVTIDYTCADGSTAQDTTSNLQPNASAHFDLETNAPSGLPANCNGSAEISSSSGEPLVVVDNQTKDGGGTQSYGAFASGTMTVSVPALYHQYYGWDASLNVRKIGSGNTDVTVTYSDGDTPSTCNLSDSSPSCLLYMPNEHPSTGYFAATVTSTDLPVVVIVNAANNANNQAQTYEGLTGGAGTVGLPTVMKQYYGWDTSFTCQNVGTVDTTLNLSYENYVANAYNTSSLSPGESVEIYQPNETFLQDGYRGSVTVTANASGAKIACIVNQTHPDNVAAGLGDWSRSYRAE